MPDPQGLAKDARQAPEFVLRRECRAFPARRSLAAKSGCRDDTHSPAALRLYTLVFNVLTSNHVTR